MLAGRATESVEATGESPSVTRSATPVATSSLGRLFDAAAALLGLCRATLYRRVNEMGADAPAEVER